MATEHKTDRNNNLTDQWKGQIKETFRNIFPERWYAKVLYERALVVILILLQLAVFIYFLLNVSRISKGIAIGMYAFSWLIVAKIVLGSKLIDYKLSWTILVLAFPLVGGVLYVLLETNLFNRRLRKDIQMAQNKIKPYRRSNPELYKILAEYKQDENSLASYIDNSVHYPLYEDGRAEYLSSGEDMYDHMIESIRGARHYIFLEFFIVKKGYMLENLLELLSAKVKEGVEVCFLYDDVGTMLQLPRSFAKTLTDLGIRARPFNTLRPILSTQFNNRDHRKIVVIDGRVAYTGGINIGDEYINKEERFGHWKDGGVAFYGEAAWAMTLMFLELWLAMGTDAELESLDVASYCPDPSYLDPNPKANPETLPAFIQPYSDSPFDFNFIGKMVYQKLIYNAGRYVYLMTPYLILDDDMVAALRQAARSGVDVRIITPHIFDKQLVKQVTRSYYQSLLEAGVRIFEYTPGFIHTKALVTDDETAVIGTINFDYRSFYLHFEDAVVVYNQPCVGETYDDFLETQAQSQEIFPHTFKWGFWHKLAGAFLRLFAPLM